MEFHHEPESIYATDSSGKRDRYSFEVQELSRAILEGTPPSFSVEASLRNMRDEGGNIMIKINGKIVFLMPTPTYGIKMRVLALTASAMWDWVAAKPD